MKIDRLIGILSILLQKEKVTAPYLADKFEVSRRTINRDIEDICKAGIPIVTMQGVHGGISIMEGYSLSKTLLTSSDMQAILAGLRSLDSVVGTNRYQQLMEKLAVGTSDILTSNQHILIDLSSWYKSTLAPKIELIQWAIDKKKLLEITYYSPSGESTRVMEPYTLVFQWSSWYMWGYCRLREDYRLFKLNRITKLKELADTYIPRDPVPYQPEWDSYFYQKVKVTAVFEPHMKWRLVEEYGIDSFSVQEDGTLLFQFGFADEASVLSWILSFGDTAELLEPFALRDEFQKIIKRIGNKYSNHDI